MRRMESDVTGRSRCVWVRMVTAIIRQLELELIQTYNHVTCGKSDVHVTGRP